MGDSSSDVSQLAQNGVAIRIALGGGRGDADPSGALAAVASQRGGGLALWIAAAAFLFMAL